MAPRLLGILKSEMDCAQEWTLIDPQVELQDDGNTHRTGTVTAEEIWCPG
ncbi:MAG: hypothetical protein KDC10_06950 [Calditrichaeota bacterium]|nr:hypothetical protein [Calditrichota bacterium]